MSGTLQPRAAAMPEAPRRRLWTLWPSVTVGLLVFLTAYDKASFGLSARATAAIVAVWALLLGFGLGVWPRARPPRAALIVAGLLGAFALWTFLSIFWAESAENAFTEFNRVTLYLALFLVAVCAGTRASVRQWTCGLAVGITATAIVALISRLFPSTFSLQGFLMFLPGAVTRLSFPVGYWNGLGIFVGFAYPLWLGSATIASRWWTQAVSMMPFPGLAAVIYLTSSRGGVAAALIGSLVFVATTARRWTAFGAMIIAGAGSVAGVAVLLPRHALVDGPVRSHEAALQGHTAFLLILAVSLGAGALFAFGRGLVRGWIPSRVLGWAIVALVCSGLITAIVASHPGQRFDRFKEFPGVAEVSAQGDATLSSHLLSGSGSGRWQFWTAALHEWKSAPIVGRGAGSYQAWWAAHAPFSYFVRNAHSLYLEVLGELGAIGFLFLAATFGYGAIVAVRNTTAREGDERVALASLVGLTAAFYLGAGLEWIWQLPTVAGVGLISLGLLTGAGGLHRLRPASTRVGSGTGRMPRFAIGLAALALGWFVVCAQSVPWLTDIQLRASAKAADRDDGDAAFRHALDAKSVQPWASSPYLQLALVEEQRDDLVGAQRWIKSAIDRNPVDWRLWLVAARLETKAGNLPSARKSLLEAERLNPRSPLFRSAG